MNINVKERGIVLYGEPDEITQFIEQYTGILDIRFVITDHKKEVKLQEYKGYGIPTCLIEDVTWEDELIVICDRTRYKANCNRLIYLGKKEYEDYISRELVESLLFGKKLLVCMGTHLMEQVCVLLAGSEAFTQKYSIVFFRESEIYEIYRNRLEECKHVCRLCDSYIRSSCEKEKFPLKIIPGSFLKKECEVITVADYGFAGYYPQLERDRDVFSDLFVRERERLEIRYETLFGARKDKKMEQLCRENKSAEEIVNSVLGQNLFTEESVLNYFDEEVERFKTLEINDTIKLGDFIEANRDKYLCRNLNEWNEPVVSYVADRILNILGFAPLTMGKTEKEDLLEQKSGSEILVYPSVQEALGIRTVLKNKKYRVVTYYSERYLDEREFVCYTVEYLQKALELLKFMGVDEELQQSLEL